MSDSNHNSEKIKVLNTPISPVLFDISQLLNTQLDKETLATCVGLIESGINPEALAVSSVCIAICVAFADGLMGIGGCHSGVEARRNSIEGQ